MHLLFMTVNFPNFQRYLIALCLVFAIVYVNATPEPVAEAEAEADAAFSHASEESAEL